MPPEESLTLSFEEIIASLGEHCHLGDLWENEADLDQMTGKEKKKSAWK